MGPRTGRWCSAIGAMSVLWGIGACSDNNPITGPPSFNPVAVVTHDQLKAALMQAVDVNGDGVPDGNAGLNLNMWATVVDTAGGGGAGVYTRSREGDPGPGRPAHPAPKSKTPTEFR